MHHIFDVTSVADVRCLHNHLHRVMGRKWMRGRGFKIQTLLHNLGHLSQLGYTSAKHKLAVGSHLRLVQEQQQVINKNTKEIQR